MTNHYRIFVIDTVADWTQIILGEMAIYESNWVQGMVDQIISE